MTDQQGANQHSPAATLLFPRLGLAARTRIWIVGLILLAVTAAGLTHQTLERLQSGLQRVIENELDQLMESVRLVQQCEALISQSLSLAQSQSQEERRRQWVDQQDRLDWVRKMTRQVASRAHTDADLLARVERAQDLLAKGMAELDDLVHQRLRLAGSTERGTMQALARLDERIAQTAMLNRGIGAELSVLMGYFSADTRSRMRERVDLLSAEVRRQQTWQWALTAVMVFLMLVLGAYLQRSVVSRVVRLQRGVSQQPVDKHALALTGRDEIARLAQTVRLYVDRIEANEAQLHRANRDLTYLAEHDPLTRLANRRHFDAAARRMMAALRTPLAVVALDVDRFKDINDRYGHDVGDQALIHVAQCLSGALRERDVLARFGGEEFVVLMPIANLEAAVEVCDRMRLNVSNQPVPVGGRPPVPVTVSIGVTLVTGLPFHADDVAAGRVLQKALQEADTAMYKAKDGGRNRVCTSDLAVVAAGASEGVSL